MSDQNRHIGWKRHASCDSSHTISVDWLTGEEASEDSTTIRVDLEKFNSPLYLCSWIKKIRHGDGFGNQKLYKEILNSSSCG